MQLRQKISENLAQSDGASLWLIDFRAYEHEAASLLALLDMDEKRRVEAYKLPDKALAYIIAHGFIRLLLSEILQLPAETLQFSQGNYGKPYLVQAPEISFNLSYAKRFLIFGHVSNAQIGVDIEAIGTASTMMRVIAQLHADERNALLALDADEQIKAFYRLWTCKEAYIKAVGKGLSLPLDSFALDLGKPTSIKGQVDWFFHEFKFEHEHLGAVASNQAKSLRLIRI